MDAESRDVYIGWGNRSGSVCRVDEEGLEVAHNGVRGDDVVVVREAKRGSNGITNRTREDVIMSGRSLVGLGLWVLVSLLGGQSVFGQEPAPAAAPAPAATATVEERLDDVREESGGAVALEDLGV